MKRITHEHFSRHDHLITISDEEGICRVSVVLLPSGSFGVQYFDSSGQIRAWISGLTEGHFTSITEYEAGSENLVTLNWRRTDEAVLSREEVQKECEEHRLLRNFPQTKKKEMPLVELDHISECVRLPDDDYMVNEVVTFDPSGIPIGRCRSKRSRTTHKRHVESSQRVFSPEEIEELRNNRLLKE